MSSDIGYKWYIFRIYIEENEIKIFDTSYKLLKNIKYEFTFDLEKIIKNRDKNLIKILENILQETKLES